MIRIQASTFVLAALVALCPVTASGQKSTSDALGPPATGATAPTTTAPTTIQKVDPATRAAAVELFRVTRTDTAFDKVIPQIFDGFLKAFPSLSKEIRELQPQMTQKYNPRKAVIVAEFADLYATKFTLEELQAAIAFQSATPAQRVTTPPLQSYSAKREVLVTVQEQMGAKWGERLGFDIGTEIESILLQRGITIPTPVR